MRNALVAGTMAGAMLVSGCSPESAPDMAEVASESTHRPLAPAPLTSELPAPTETATEPDVAPTPSRTKGSKQKSLGSIVIDSCTYYDVPLSGMTTNKIGTFRLRVDPGKLFWSNDYEPGSPIPQICKTETFGAEALADSLLVSLDKANTTPNKPMTYSMPPTSSKAPQTIRVELAQGDLMLSSSKGATGTIACDNEKQHIDAAVCNDMVISPLEVMESLLDPQSKLRGTFQDMSTLMYLVKASGQENARDNDAVVSFDLSPLADS